MWREPNLCPSGCTMVQCWFQMEIPWYFGSLPYQNWKNIYVKIVSFPLLYYTKKSNGFESWFFSSFRAALTNPPESSMSVIMTSVRETLLFSSAPLKPSASRGTYSNTPVNSIKLLTCCAWYLNYRAGQRNLNILSGHTQWVDVKWNRMIIQDIWGQSFTLVWNCIASVQDCTMALLNVWFWNFRKVNHWIQILSPSDLKIPCAHKHRYYQVITQLLQFL